ncbi:MAG: phosphoserine transaminase [Mobiluncus porci]|uniref:phosphoserine transaminase n=1 Tax=Mobiluncus porci TaxID=2652278 RepID=A0A7K0K2K9_9ACTO|nr:phosphoserine transaminase [Mobiluncus porci]MDD7541357.1 phosphoserine transaminase [Mobiluncus porci]MDY5747840.1 phosphoserine transaminase [Mobiluncus porci]MST49722.1 phosphoserine transaminase [Mobiluncus porci]
MSDIENLKIPSDILPRDGRFGNGPTLIRQSQLDALAHSKLMGTSHRQAPVKDLVKDCQQRLAALFGMPTDYEVVLGNGGATTFWALATCSLVERRAAHGVFGEFGNKFAQETQGAPFLEDSRLTKAEMGDSTLPELSDDVDVYAWPHQETSTGAIAPVTRIGTPDQLVLVDATSIAGSVPVDLSQTDAYYFSLQKALGSDGGLWFAFLSPRAIARAEKLSSQPSSGRWIPSILNLTTAVNNSRKNQTLNTPAIATLELLHSQLVWIEEELGGLAGAEKRVRESSDAIHAWAYSRDFASSFVTNPEKRSPVVSTIDLADTIDVAILLQVLRQNGIVDINPYRSLGRNQLRIGTFPSTDPADTKALLASLDYVAERLLGK